MQQPGNRIIKLGIVLLTLWLALGIGCGGSSSSSSDNDDSGGDNGDVTQPADTASEEDINKTIDASVSALAQSAEKGESYETMSSSFGSVSGGAQTQAKSVTAAENTFEFTCGTFTQDGQSFTYVFNGSCDGLTGTMIYQVESSGEDSITYSIEYVDFTADDSCYLDGKATITTNTSGSTTSWTYAYDDMSICGETRSGTYTLKYDESGAVYYELDDEEFTYQGSITVDTDFDYDATGGLTGSATVTADDETYQINANNVVVDTSCGIPTSGSMTITLSDGSTVNVDFSGSTCSNPSITYTWNGTTYSYTLTGGSAS